MTATRAGTIHICDAEGARGMLLMKRRGRHQAGDEGAPKVRDKDSFIVRHEWWPPRSARKEDDKSRSENLNRIGAHSFGIHKSSACCVTLAGSTSHSSHDWRS
jgi:hypothetical protein